jgi:hypothetical protein
MNWDESVRYILQNEAHGLKMHLKTSNIGSHVPIKADRKLESTCPITRLHVHWDPCITEPLSFPEHAFENRFCTYSSEVVRERFSLTA